MEPPVVAPTGANYGEGRSIGEVKLGLVHRAEH